MKLPAFQFYPADWRKDPGVQALSYHDRGVWFEILCLMHESEQRGKLTLNGKPMPEDALARLLGLDKQNLTKVISLLLEYGVASRDDQGCLINRRMVRDEEIRQIRAEAGQKGGQERVKRQNDFLLKQNSSKNLKEIKQNSTPSSSSSITRKEEDKEEKFSYYVGDQGTNLLYEFLQSRFFSLVENLQKVYPEPVFSKALDDFLTKNLSKKWKDENDLRTHLNNSFRVYDEKKGESIRNQAKKKTSMSLSELQVSTNGRTH